MSKSFMHVLTGMCHYIQTHTQKPTCVLIALPLSHFLCFQKLDRCVRVWTSARSTDICSSDKTDSVVHINHTPLPSPHHHHLSPPFLSEFVPAHLGKMKLDVFKTGTFWTLSFRFWAHCGQLLHTPRNFYRLHRALSLFPTA